MPANMSNYLENALMNKILKGSAWTPVASPYLALFTALTTSADGDTVTEVSTSGTAYARQSIAFNAASAGATANTANVVYPQATANFGTINYWGVYDAATAGNLLYWGPISNPLSVNTGEIMQVNAGDLTISLSGNITTTYANNILNTSLRGTALATPAGYYAALLTAFTNDATYTECADTSYARQSHSYGTISNGTGTNAADIAYAAMAAQQTLTHVAVFDAVTAGNMIFRGALTQSKTVDAGKIFKILTGNLSIALD